MLLQAFDNIVFSKLISSVPVVAAYQSDRGITTTANGAQVMSWAPTAQTSGSWTLITSASNTASAPAYAAKGLNGQPTVTFDGTDDILWSFPNVCHWGITSRPFTRPSWAWGIVKQVSWTNTDRLFRMGVPCAEQGPTTPNIRQAFIITGPTTGGGTLGQFFRFEEYHVGSTSNYTKVGATTTTGTNTDGTAIQISDLHQLIALGGIDIATPGGGFNLSLASNVAWVAAMVCEGLPSVAERAALDAAVTRKYGTAVLI